MLKIKSIRVSKWDSRGHVGGVDSIVCYPYMKFSK